VKPGPTVTATRPRPTATATRDAGDSDNNVGELDALRLVIEAETAAKELETMTFVQNLDFDFQIFQQNMVQTCYVELPDSSYCVTEAVVSFAGQEPVTTTNEVVQNGDQVWLREGEGDWQELPPDTIEQIGLSEEGLGQLRMSDYMLEATLAGETIIDGVSVDEVTFDLDVNAYFQSILGEAAAEQFLASASDGMGSGTMWIGQEDKLTRKALIEMSFTVEGQQLVVSTQAVYTDFNQPVEIPDPTAD
jgi:hypothetical protein